MCNAGYNSYAYAGACEGEPGDLEDLRTGCDPFSEEGCGLSTDGGYTVAIFGENFGKPDANIQKLLFGDMVLSSMVGDGSTDGLEADSFEADSFEADGCPTAAPDNCTWTKAPVAPNPKPPHPAAASFDGYSHLSGASRCSVSTCGVRSAEKSRIAKVRPAYLRVRRGRVRACKGARLIRCYPLLITSFVYL